MKKNIIKEIWFYIKGTAIILAFITVIGLMTHFIDGI